MQIFIVVIDSVSVNEVFFCICFVLFQAGIGGLLAQ